MHEIININLKATKIKLNKVKLKSATHRKIHLRQQVDVCEFNGNKKIARYLRNLITIEQ